MDWANPELLFEIIISALAVVIWLIRLEGKVLGLSKELSLSKELNAETQKDVDALRLKQEAIDERLAIELKEINIKLAQIEGFLMRTKPDGR
jgi:hypothetical protein